MATNKIDKNKVDNVMANFKITDGVNAGRKKKMVQTFRVPSYVSGGGTTINSSYVMDKYNTKSFIMDDQQTIQSIGSTDTATKSSNPYDRKRYLEEILNLDTAAADDYFDKKFAKDGVLINMGKLMSDKMKDNLFFKRGDDPRLPNLDVTSARTRARLRFEGWYNRGLFWGNPESYTEGGWYSAKADSEFYDEIKSLSSDSDDIKDSVGNKLDNTYNTYNYHFNLGLGFGESQVMNPPFQYNNLDDPRTHPRYTKIGRVYVEKVLNHMPMVMVMPGRIKYHTNALKLMGVDMGAAKANAEYIRSDNWFTGLISAAWMGLTDIVGTSIAFATSIFSNGRLITFRQQINLFKKYFDNTVTQLANNMGLLSPTGLYCGRWKMLSLDHILPGIGYRRTGIGLGKGWRSNQMICFNIGKTVSCSETMSNSTRENPLAESLNSQSEEQENDKKNGSMNFWGNAVKDLFNTWNTKDPRNLAGTLGTVGLKLGANVSEMLLIKSGLARIMLPEVWSSSSFSRSYNLTFTLYSPYGIPHCKFETWGPTLAFWLTATLPRQVGSFSYVEPFVLRIVMPGKFNINYGIVESLTIDRGEDKDDWSNTDNLPKTIKLTISIKDFQPSIMLPQASRSLIKQGYEALFPASGFAEYMSTICGLSLADQFDWKRRLGRSFRQWTAGWRRRVNSDILSSTISNINPVQHIMNIFLPFYDVYDKVEVLEDKARLKEYTKNGIKAMKAGALSIKQGLETGAFFNYPIRAITRFMYNTTGTRGATASALSFIGKILNPSATDKVGYPAMNNDELKEENELEKSVTGTVTGYKATEDDSTPSSSQISSSAMPDTPQNNNNDNGAFTFP